jgi:predicted phage gp36 major capsid-like protein
MSKFTLIRLPVAALLYRIMADAADPVEDLQARMLDLQEQATSIQARADAESRDLTEDEQKELDGIFAKFDELDAQLQYRNNIEQRHAKLTETLGRRVKPDSSDDDDDSFAARAAVDQRGGVRISLSEDNATRGRWGFRSFGEFASAVRQGARGNVDPRLVANAPTTYSTEGVGADGGFAVPPDFREAIMEKSSGGIQAYWEGEGKQIAQSKLNLESSTLRLNKLTALVPVTEELLEDAPTLDSYLRRKVPEKFDFAVNLAIVQGNGVGRPIGILSAPATVSVAKETSQVADTVLTENILKMYSRMYGACRATAIWLINQDIEPQLNIMMLRVLNAAGNEYVGGGPVYTPPGGLSASPYATLLGRPVIPTEACETLGDKGDIIFADLTRYLTAVKTGGIRQDVSIHLWFDYDMTAYRFIFRVGGMPWWGSAISPRDGSNTRSCFVTLDERA